MIPERLSTATLVLREQGPQWISERLAYAAKRKLGLIERSTPVSSWASLPTPEGVVPSVVAVEQLRGALQVQQTPGGLARLRDHHEDLLKRRFDFFGQNLPMQSWHHDPVSGVEYPSALHWSGVPEDNRADLKHIWEPSRFAWTYDLIRLHLIEPDSGAAETWWQLFEDWCESNQPNSGVNWSCGQEASIRLMAVTCALATLDEAMTEQRWELARTFTLATGTRVAANIGYARLQRNNHLSSEAAGLLTASLILPNHTLAPSWRTQAAKELDFVVEKLIFPDGGSSQYSMNYHRVFVQGLLWSSMVAKHQGLGLPAVDEALDRAVAFTHSLVQDASGFGPRFGHDDGADILPVQSQAKHRDMRPVLNLAASLGFGPGKDKDSKESAEAGAWFRHPTSQAPQETTHLGTHQVGHDDTHEDTIIRSEQAIAETFSDTGLTVIAGGGSTVYCRATEFRFRPAHADQLSIEVWHAGQCLVQDPGTLSYKFDSNQIPSARSHSTITLAGQDHMRRVGRFLFAGWTRASGTSSLDPEPAWRARHQLTSTISHTREVRILVGGVVLVEDTVTSQDPEAVELAWCGVPSVKVILADSDSDSRQQVSPKLDLISSGERYGNQEQAPVTRIGSPAARRHRFVSLIEPASSSIVVTRELS